MVESQEVDSNEEVPQEMEETMEDMVEVVVSNSSEEGQVDEEETIQIHQHLYCQNTFKERMEVHTKVYSVTHVTVLGTMQIGVQPQVQVQQDGKECSTALH